MARLHHIGQPWQYEWIVTVYNCNYLGLHCLHSVWSLPISLYRGLGLHLSGSCNNLGLHCPASRPAFIKMFFSVCQLSLSPCHCHRWPLPVFSVTHCGIVGTPYNVKQLFSVVSLSLWKRSLKGHIDVFLTVSDEKMSNKMTSLELR